jgi:hypothetical protein
VILSQDAHSSVQEPPSYADYIATLRADQPDLAEVFGRSDSLENVLLWMEDHPPCGAVDIVGQDEFSYDFLIPFEPAGRWLAFGVN